MSTGFHPPLEEYLETIHELEAEGTHVIQARLAERLGHSAPAVSEMVRRLRSGGYVRVQDRSVRLTPKGRARAESVVRKHRLAERLLVDVIGLEWHKIHAEAGRWEHVISDDVEEKLVALLGNPATCPHGNPIPGARSQAVVTVPLPDLPAGTRFRLERITEQLETDIDSLRYLDGHAFIPGTSATLRARAPDGTLTVEVRGATVAVGRALAGQLYVSVPG